MYRIRLIFICLSLLISAGCFSGGGILNSETTKDQDLSAYNQNGVNVQIESVEKSDKGILLTMRAINGTDDTKKLSSRSDPIILQDNQSAKYPSKEEEIELQPFTNNLLTIEFYESDTAATENLTLYINSKFGNEFGSPKLTVANIPFPGGGKITFKSNVFKNLENIVKNVNHPNGTTLTVKAIRFGKIETEVDMTIVNGSKNEIKLAEGSDKPYLRDEQSRRFYLVPPETNPKLEVPESQKISGTFRFAGRIPTDAAKLSLYVNEKGSDDSEYSRSPRLIINDIPIK